MSVTFGLTDSGFIAPREADFLVIIRDDYKARLLARGLPDDVDFKRDVFLGNITANMAARLGKLGEGQQALYDAFNPNNAKFLQLDNLSLLVGVQREEATASQVPVTYTGTVGTPVNQGDVVEGGGTNDDQRWTVSADVLIGGGGTVDVVVVAQDKGAVVALAGSVDEIVTLRAGLTSVTNALDATVGQAQELDSALRKRRQESLAISGGRNRKSLQAKLTALESVIASAVIDNDDLIQTVVAGFVLEPKSVQVVIHPATLTLAQKQEVALLIADQVADGIFINGSDVVATWTGADGSTKIVRWDFATESTVNVLTEVTLKTNFELGDVEQPIKDAVKDYFASLGVGDDVRRLPILALIDEVNGVKGADVKLNGFDQDVLLTVAEIAKLGTNNVVVV